MLLNWLAPWMHKVGLGKLPGDFRFRLFGQDWYLPFASTVVLSFLASLIGYLV